MPCWMHADAHVEDRRRLGRDTWKGKGEGKGKTPPQNKTYHAEPLEDDEETAGGDEIQEEEPFDEEELLEESTDEEEPWENFYAWKVQLTKKGFRPGSSHSKGKGSDARSVQEWKKSSRCADCGQVGLERRRSMFLVVSDISKAIAKPMCTFQSVSIMPEFCEELIDRRRRLVINGNGLDNVARVGREGALILDGSPDTHIKRVVRCRLLGGVVKPKRKVMLSHLVPEVIVLRQMHLCVLL